MEGDPTGADDAATEIDGHGAPTVIERPQRVVTQVPTPPPISVTTITTAAEAMHEEEVQRTRMFIRIAWVATAVGLGAVPFVETTRWMATLFIAALMTGVVVSAFYHQRFRDPAKYGPRPMYVLGVMSAFNATIAV